MENQRQTLSKKSKAIILDRDGVLNKEVEGYATLGDLVLIDETFKTIAYAKKLFGYKLFVATNQGGIELGLINQFDVIAIHEEMNAYLMQKYNVEFDGLYFCPHYETRCNCRKPAPGMLLRIAEDHLIDLKESFFFGDRITDIQAGHAAGVGNVVKVEKNHGVKLDTLLYLQKNAMKRI